MDQNVFGLSNCSIFLSVISYERSLGWSWFFLHGNKHQSFRMLILPF